MTQRALRTLTLLVVAAALVACDTNSRSAVEEQAGPCEDECSGDGDRSCSDEAGYRTCGEHDSDECLEWSEVVACEQDERCEGGECLPVCTDACDVGELRCEGTAAYATCGNFDRDECLEFGPAISCGVDERCDGGQCVAAADPCEDACETEGDRVCEGTEGYRRCGQYDADRCLDLSSVVDCGSLATCEAGECVPICEDECVSGQHRCDDGGLQTCGNFNEEPCLEWGPAAPCPEGEVCDDGACVEQQTCEDVCAEGDTECDGERALRRCGQHDEDECLELGPSEPCGEGERCALGECVDDCEDECDEGDVACQAGGLSTCGQHDDDTCLELGPPEACADGLSCVGGECVEVCEDECGEDDVRCAAGETEALQRCGPSQLDDCLHWGSAEPCDADEACTEGACETVCQDECETGDRRCVGDSYEVCGQFDEDACLEYGGGDDCGEGERCVDGVCDVPCEDECDAQGDRACVDGDDTRYLLCGSYDGDPCLDWSVAEECPAGTRCNAGQCEDVPPPATVVINELLYDGPSTEDPQWAFVELWGPGGTPLEGFRLVGINGATGDEYRVIELSGSIPADGYFVLAHTDAREELAAEADRLDGGADLQNGPDSVQLRFNALVVDALGYGAAAPHFAGEGTAAALVEPGQSLSRDEDHTDTDDNVADFTASDPSPGAAAPEACPEACPAAGAIGCGEGEWTQRCVELGGCLVWMDDEDCASDGGVCATGVCAQCGDGELDAGEECDGGEGCDDGCHLVVGAALDQFQRVYTFELEDAAPTFIPNDVVALPDGRGWYVAGWGTPTNEGEDALVARLGPDGALLWVRAFGETGHQDDRFYDLLLLEDGDLVAVGSTESWESADVDAFALRLGPGGQVVWAQAFGAAGEDVLRAVTATTDGAYVAVGSTEAFSGDFRTDVMAVRVDAAGVVAWSKAYGSDRFKWDVGHGVVAQADGAVFVVAESDSWDDSIYDDILVIGLTAQGGVSLAKTHSFYDVTLERTSLAGDGDILVAGSQRSYDEGGTSSFFSRIAPDGESVFRATYSDEYTTLKHAVETPDGEMVVVGRDVDLIWDRWVAEDQRRVKQSRRLGGGGGNWEAAAVAPSPDGGLLIAGRDNSSRLWVLRANADDETGGCHLWDAGTRSVRFADPNVTARQLRSSELQLELRTIDAAPRAPAVVESLECSVE